jgi:hypothetical protein
MLRCLLPAAGRRPGPRRPLRRPAPSPAPAPARVVQVVAGDMDATLLRFLRARKLDMDATWAMLTGACQRGGGGGGGGGGAAARGGDCCAWLSGAAP